MGRILALDYGEKRIGVALTDETKTIAIMKPYIETKKQEKLLSFVKENEVDEILLGLPKSLSGAETASAEKVRGFGSWLEKETKIRVNFIDERFTTTQARKKLQFQGLKDKNLRKQLDSMSAYIILEEYLKKFKKLVISN